MKNKPELFSSEKGRENNVGIYSITKCLIEEDIFNDMLLDRKIDSKAFFLELKSTVAQWVALLPHMLRVPGSSMILCFSLY